MRQAVRQAWILVVVALAAAVAAPALAQKAKTAAHGGPQIIVTEANLPDAYTAVGALSVTVHPRSMNPKTPTHDLLDAELRNEAAKLGADVVVQVRYVLRNPMMSDKGSDAMGVAVKFTGVAAAAAPSAPPGPAPAQLAAAQPATAISPPVQPPAQPPARATTSATPPAPAPVLPTPAPTAAPAASAPVEPSTPTVAVAAAAPAPALAEARHATSADMIIVTDQDYAGRRYRRVGDVRSEVHQKSLWPKTPSRDLLNADLKAQALKLGADAVLLVKYDMHNALTSQRGDTATGVAVRFE